MRVTHRPIKLVTVLWATVLMATACSAASRGDVPETAETWGDDAVVFYERLAEAYRADDSFAILDFYAPEARIDKWRGDNRGGSAVQDLLQWNSGDLHVVVLSVNLGTQAVNFARWPNSSDLGAVVSEIADGRIQGEVAYDLGISLGRSLRASPDVLATYDDLYVGFLDAAAGTGPPPPYAAGARIHDPVMGLADVDASDSAIADIWASWEPVTAIDVFGDDAPGGGHAVFLGPTEYGTDPLRALGVYRVEDQAGCQHQLVVRWTLDDNGDIVDEYRYHDVASFRTCGSDRDLPSGWWTGLELPGPADQVETGTVTTGGGQTISVRNGTDRLEDLLRWGLDRFAAGGLSEPEVDAVTFQPSRSCVGRSGRLVDDGTTRNLYVCMYDSNICTLLAPCDVPATRARLAVLHEFAHAWMIDNVTEEMQERLVELSGRIAWDGSDITWVNRGVEYAADNIAWGLIEEDLEMVRIGSPSCADLSAAFELLTGVAARSAGEACTDR